MKLNNNQSQYAYLTLELETKTKEYQSLCNQLDECKAKQLDENCDEYKTLLSKFIKNNEEIKNIKNKLNALK